jgi:histidine triad (HIT) family protein
MAPTCVFCDIVHGRMLTKKVFEDRLLLAFHDRQPEAPVHLLIIPKEHRESLGALANTSADQRLVGRMMLLARHLAHELGVHETGYRLVMNAGDDAGMAVRHLHLHLLAGRPFAWPPG